MNAMVPTPRPVDTPELTHIDTFNARDLVKNGVQACIVLDEQVYYLRITRAGKLILTK